MLYFPPEALAEDVDHLMFRVMDLSETRRGAGIIIEVPKFISACERFITNYILSQKTYIFSGASSIRLFAWTGLHHIVNTVRGDIKLSISVPAALEALKSAKDALQVIGEWKRKNKGDARALIIEIEENFRYLRMVAFDGVPLSDVVENLAVDEYKRLAREGYNFNQLQKKKIKDDPSFEKSQLSSWVGKSTEELIDSIYSKITDLRILYPHNMKNDKYRWGVRVKNIIKLIWLLLKHVQS